MKTRIVQEQSTVGGFFFVEFKKWFRWEPVICTHPAGRRFQKWVSDSGNLRLDFVGASPVACYTLDEAKRLESFFHEQPDEVPWRRVVVCEPLPLASGPLPERPVR